MRRDDFIENPPDTIYDLVEFCEEHDLCAAADLIEGDDLDEAVCDDIREIARNEYWYNIRDLLIDIPVGCNWYRREGSLQYEDFDDGWDTLYDAVLDEMDSYEMWDDDDEEEEEEEEWEDGEEESEDESGEDDAPVSGVFAISDLFESDLISVIRAETQESDRRKKAEEDERRRASEERRRDFEERKRAAEEASLAEEEVSVSGFYTMF